MIEQESKISQAFHEATDTNKVPTQVDFQVLQDSGLCDS